MPTPKISGGFPILEEPRTLVAAGALAPDAPHLNHLRGAGFVIDTFPSTRGLYDHIIADIPNVLLMDLDSLDTDAIGIIQKLKDNPMTFTKPIIVAYGSQEVEVEIEALEAGAEDFLRKPVRSEILCARINTSIRRNTRLQISNPLTGLPGAVYIEEQTIRRLAANRPLALCYVDIDYFKAYNDKYGYRRGDNVIRILATILNEGVSLFGAQGDFVGHVGGDDFVIILDSARVAPVCEYVTNSFDILIPFQYDEDDQEAGYIHSHSRQGEEMHFPIMTVAIGVVSNESRPIESYLQLTELAAEMKEYTKSITKTAYPPRSAFRIDKRAH